MTNEWNTFINFFPTWFKQVWSFKHFLWYFWLLYSNVTNVFICFKVILCTFSYLSCLMRWHNSIGCCLCTVMWQLMIGHHLMLCDVAISVPIILSNHKRPFFHSEWTKWIKKWTLPLDLITASNQSDHFSYIKCNNELFHLIT